MSFIEQALRLALNKDTSSLLALFALDERRFDASSNELISILAATREGIEPEIFDSLILLLFGVTFQEVSIPRSGCFNDEDWQVALTEDILHCRYNLLHSRHAEHIIGAILVNSPYASVRAIIKPEDFKLVVDLTFIPYATPILERGNREDILSILQYTYFLPKRFSLMDLTQNQSLYEYCKLVLNLCIASRKDTKLLCLLVAHLSPFYFVPDVNAFLNNLVTETKDDDSIELHEACLLAIIVPSETDISLAMQMFSATYLVKWRFVSENKDYNESSLEIFELLKCKYLEQTLDESVVQYLWENGLKF